jgi:hypothetical protein
MPVEVADHAVAFVLMTENGDVNVGIAQIRRALDARYRDRCAVEIRERKVAVNILRNLALQQLIDSD